MKSSKRVRVTRTVGMISVAVLVAATAACGASDTGGASTATAIEVGNDGETADVSTAVGTAELVFSQQHRAWRAEPAVHRSTGPHGDVRVYYNDKYADAWTAGAFPMPVGAMSVKEIYDGDEVDGYAAAIKTSEGSGAGT